ncbi:2-succinyl-5-enolpyruvyl-6-hydroxy-3-cyclohexene-1-carboxylic-acid synthase [Gephyromycinifex aptenodytis]|uniref:2-succinyl-5-enolpyruvyl-6-hydroxy-3- cyclohexene-1-carboxylic-acid synthase n=1 Tax=Gephyromycinifex aptenodytis TaxID=2716227 RepID=UPI0014455D1B|nr:2-succinyl-5-enolpyruvyl-6-hydroxy-3-cyclohexene-1-carboxylic-acid synthase [Gephyromycinifex aptenodytis]
MELTSPTPSAALCGVLVDELCRLGVREVVLCPGSRSAPLAYAFHEADRAGRLRLHVRVDERSAAFLALGLAKASGMPAPVVTTSGTAVANLHPAVLEAHEAGVPMLLLTADRPPELRGTRANQTTDQVKVFGGAVRWAHDLETPAVRIGIQQAWRTGADRAMAAALGALGADPGPVHLNIPLRDPLVPADRGQPPWPESLEGRPNGSPWTRVGLDPRTPRWMGGPIPGEGDMITAQPRTLIVLGDLPLRAHAEALRVADHLGHPVICEPFGQAHPDCDVLPCGNRMPHGALLAPLAQRRALRPDRILVLGRLTLSRSMAQLLRLPGVRVEMVTSGTRWPDPGHVLDAVYPWSALRLLCDSELAMEDVAATSEFLRAWSEAAREASERVRPLLDQGWPHGPAVASTLLSALPDESLLFLGSSNGVRDVDAARYADTAQVLASRGLAGIDGCVSTAVGLALATRQPTYALLGDLTFLHDTNGLLIGPGEPLPDLTIVVANDDGGGIFDTLEYGQDAQRRHSPGAFERVFATPTGVRIVDLAAAHAVPYAAACTPEELASAVRERPRGLRIVEVPLARTGRQDFAAALLRAVG